MTWARCQLTTTFEAMDAINHILERHNIIGVEIEHIKQGEFGVNSSGNDIRLIFYISTEEVRTEKINQIEEEIKKLVTLDINIGSARLSIDTISDDWMIAWEKHYEPIIVSEKIKIVPTWMNTKVKKDSKIVIELDPGLAFGTGSHATTLLMLRALERYVVNKQVVIDVGSGSGILSIAALLLGVEKAVAIDNDPLAIKSTERNASINGVEQSLIVKQGNLLNRIQTTADLIIANILAEVIVQFTDDAYKLLNPGGYFMTSGIIQRKKRMVINQLEKSQFKIIETLEQDGWICIIAQK